jgi:hypothetical protein
MGFNTTVVVLNDALDQIANDPEFGKKLADAIRCIGYRPGPHSLYVTAGNHSNAASVVETHHSSMTVVVAVGGNYGSVLGEYPNPSHHERMNQWDILEAVYDQSTSKESAPNDIRVRH